ncbi:MAG: phosphatidate cytidylyltransferase [Opitutales bacterium]
MLKRLLSTLVLWAVLIGSLWYFGAHAAVWLVTLLAALTLHEFYCLTEKMGCRPFRWMGLLFSVLITAGPFYASQYLTDGEEFAGLAPVLLALAVVVFSLRILRERDNTNRVETLVSSTLGLLYVPFLLHYMVRLLMLFDEPDSGLMLCLWVVAVAKFCDVGALLTGLTIGRHKMAPNISPKKTWEGAVGGVLIATGVGVAIAHYGADYLPEKLTLTAAALIAPVLAIVAIVSDLIESVLKRRADLKDTGQLVPGIGGAFDLTDSLILTAPVAYVIFLFLT